MSQSLPQVQISPDESKLGRNVIALGWVAFFGGLAQDMIQPILPTFLTNVLGLSKEFIGLIAAIALVIIGLFVREGRMAVSKQRVSLAVRKGRLLAWEFR
jgi:hypothetical protein